MFLSPPNLEDVRMNMLTVIALMTVWCNYVSAPWALPEFGAACIMLVL